MKQIIKTWKKLKTVEEECRKTRSEMSHLFIVKGSEDLEYKEAFVQYVEATFRRDFALGEYNEAWLSFRHMFERDC